MCTFFQFVGMSACQKVVVEFGDDVCQNPGFLCHLLCDPTIWQPGFDLPRQQWSLLNRFRTEQGQCGACRRKWRATYRHWSVSLWRDPDDVSHCRILSPDKTEWRLILVTLYGWRRCFVADQLCFMTRIREEEECNTKVTTYYMLLS